MACDQWLCILPALLALGVPVTIFITYGLSVRKDHVYPFWPYISDTGSLAPESCIFGQLLNFGAFILFFVIYLRYRQVREYAGVSTTGISKAANFSSYIIGLISCLGLDIVANFQESNLLSVHLIGAALCFIAGTVYTIFQTIFTRKMDSSRRAIYYTRATLSVISVCATIGAIFPVYWAVSANAGGDFMHWKPEHKGYNLHILSTTMEWILVFSYCTFFGSLFWDFKYLRVSEPKVAVVSANSGYGKSSSALRLDPL